MKIKSTQIGFSLFIILGVMLIFFDYIDFYSLIGLEMSNLNLTFCMGILNAILVVTLYHITFKTLDERSIIREKNKEDISNLLIKTYYEDCLDYIKFFNKEYVDKYIIPKVNFNETNNKIVQNLQNINLSNENTILDLVKDGQIDKMKMEGYLNIKHKYRQYVSMRITFYDETDIYSPLEKKLIRIINEEISKLNN